MGLLLASTLLLVPLLILPGVSFYYDVTPKVAALLFPTAAGLLWFAFRGGWPAPAARRARLLIGLAAMQLVVLGLSTALSTHPGLSLTGSTWRRFGTVTQAGLLVFTMLAVCAIRNPADLRLPLRVLCGSGCVIAVYGILQYFGIDPLIPPASYRVGEGVWTIVRPPGSLGHASYFATCCAYFAFASLALAAVEKGRIRRSVWVAAALLGACAVIFSGSRAAMLGLLAGGAFFALLLRPPLRRTLLVAGVGAALVAGFYFSPAGLKLRSRTRWFIEDPLGGARLLLWRDSIRMLSRSWAVGVGPETFALEFPQYQSVELARAYPDFYHESPHNILLDAAAGQGIPGTALLLCVIALGFHAAVAARKREPLLAAALGGSLAAGVASQQFAAFTLPTALWLYVTVVLLAAVAWPSTGVQPAPRWVRAAAIPLAVIAGWYALRLSVYDAALGGVDRDIRSGAVADAIPEYRGAREWAPGTATADLWFSRTLAASIGRLPAVEQRIQAAEASFEAALRATRTSEDRQNAFYHLAALYASRNDFANTENALRGAIRAAPNWFKPHWMLARILQLSGRPAEAREEALRAAELDGGKHPEVRETLAGSR